METLIIKVKDDSKVDFLLELLRDLTYVEVSPVSPSAEQKTRPENQTVDASRTFLDSYGMWAGRDDIDAQELRRQSGQRDNTRRS